MVSVFLSCINISSLLLLLASWKRIIFQNKYFLNMSRTVAFGRDILNAPDVDIEVSKIKIKECFY